MTTTSSVYSESGVALYAGANAVLASRIHNAGLPYVSASCGSINDRSFWACVTLSLDPKESWSHNILQNSRHAKLSIVVEKNRFVVECFSGGCKRDFTKKPFRKFRAATLEDVADRIAAWALVNK